MVMCFSAPALSLPGLGAMRIAFTGRRQTREYDLWSVDPARISLTRDSKGISKLPPNTNDFN